MVPDPFRNFTGMHEDSYGNLRWYKNGQLHRAGGLPAIIEKSGSRYWFVNNQYSRPGDKPAIEFADGVKCWYKDGTCHRENGPAIVWEDGTEEWYHDGRKLDVLEIFLIKSRQAKK